LGDLSPLGPRDGEEARSKVSKKCLQ
jgi:hypothetical protein